MDLVDKNVSQLELNETLNFIQRHPVFPHYASPAILDFLEKRVILIIMLISYNAQSNML